MIVAIHQPNLFPWLGFFDKMRQADVFILLDNVPFTKGGFQNRVRLKGPNGLMWMTVPVVTCGRLGQATCDVMCANTEPWQKKHVAMFHAAYSKASGFESLWEKLCPLYNSRCERLVDFTIAGIQVLRSVLGITTPIIRASQCGASGTRSTLLSSLVLEVGGTVYLSGPSGRNYLDEEVFRANGLQVRYHQFEPFEYPQRFGEFEPGLSALDYVFNEPSLALWRKRR